MDDMLADDSEFVGKDFAGLQAAKRTFSRVEFDGCTFRDCDFSEAVFSKCKFIDCRFLQCNLSVVKVPFSKFADVVFEACKLVGVDWTKAAWSSLSLASPLTFRECILNDSSFFRLALKEMVMEGCKARDVDFRECNLEEADFGYTDLANSLFNKTNLSRANFAEAVHYDIDILVNGIKGAKFSRYEAVRLLEGLGIALVD
ncbi:MAG TPA: pentapeptide repeat-containing protein [Pseudomonadales bacterium]|nr:pentapeptide repeat-containing protein [Pseudomonadales bacterium]